MAYIFDSGNAVANAEEDACTAEHISANEYVRRRHTAEVKDKQVEAAHDGC